MDEIIICSSESSAEPITAASVLDAILKGFGKFSKSLGSLAQSMMDSGYNINRVTRGPRSTVWQVGNDEYKKTHGASGYLCQVQLSPHPIQNGPVPTYSVAIQTISGLQQHSFTVENVAQPDVWKAIQSTMQAWDAADNKNAESIQAYANNLVKDANDFISEAKQKCDEGKEKVKAMDDGDTLSRALDDLKRDVTDSTEDLIKYFKRHFRDANSAEDKLAQCTAMEDNLEDSRDTFRKSLDDILGSDETSDETADQSEQGTQNEQSEAADESSEQPAAGEESVQQAQIFDGKRILASVRRCGDAEVIIHRIVASYDSAEVADDLQTVLYDNAVLEQIPEDKPVTLEVVEEPDDWDVQVVERQDAEWQAAPIMILRAAYRTIFNAYCIRYNFHGPNCEAVFNATSTLKCYAEDIIDETSKVYVELVGSVPQPMSYLTPDGLIDPTGISDDAALVILQNEIQQLISCLDLYRCNFSDDVQLKYLTFIRELNELSGFYIDKSISNTNTLYINNN